jgi:acyl-CoA thioesterase-1
MVDKARTFNPQPVIVLAGMRMPMNFGDYGKGFAEVYPRLAEKNKIVLHPFLLEGVALDPAPNQDDMIHPNAKGQILIAENLWKTLKPLAEKAGGK